MSLYHNKYLKYKNKYINLKYKIQIGGVYQFIDDKLTGIPEDKDIISSRQDKIYKIDNDPTKITKIFAEDNDTTKKEVLITKSLSDLNLSYFPKFYGSDILNSKRYIVIEKIKGKDYRTYVRDNYLSKTDMNVDNFVNWYLNFIKQIATALQIALKQICFTHEDFDTKNCMVRDDGTPVIIDFGVSQLGESNCIKSAESCHDIASFIRTSTRLSNYKHENEANFTETEKTNFDNIIKSPKILDLLKCVNTLCVYGNKQNIEIIMNCINKI